MAVPVTHPSGVAHRRLIAGLLNLLDSRQPIEYDEVDVSSGSPTDAEFENMPSWAQKIQLKLNDVSTSNTSSYRIQVKDSTGWVTAGYLSDSSVITSVVATTNATSGIVLRSTSAAWHQTGIVTGLKVNDTTWVFSGVTGFATGATGTVTAAGKVTISGAIEGIRLNSNTGTFDAGTVGCRVER